MATEINTARVSLNWFEIWRTAFVHPTIQTFSRIASDSKTSTLWGSIWMAITALIVWIIGPHRTLWWGLVAETFGLDVASYFVAIGTVVFPILGVMALFLCAAMSHGLARLFNGAGTLRQLVFCWGVMPVPFVMFAGLAFNVLPLTYSMFLVLSSSEVNFPVMGIMTLIGAFFAVAGILYLFYGQVVAYSAIEKFRVKKGLGILVLLGFALGVISAGLSVGLQEIVMRSFRY
jgi:hypothetical protein